ncbi:SWEET7D [Symbiodinium sp. KB8]|nr:SWEET7D [Symbiodinium sp. KB8]
MGELLRPAKNLEIFVRLRILDDAEVVSMDGHQCFDSPTREGSASPSWSGLDHGGQHDGWVFRSQIFLPERMPNLWLELEVINIGIAGEELVGRVKVPITKKNFLTNAKAPFRNLWLPLALPLPDADGKWQALLVCRVRLKLHSACHGMDGAAQLPRQSPILVSTGNHTSESLTQTMSRVDTVVEGAGTVLAMFFLSSPMPQVWQAQKTPAKVDLINPITILSMYGNCAAQVVYGIYRPLPAAVPCNLYGLAVSLYYLGSCWWCAAKFSGALQWNSAAAGGTVASVMVSLLMWLYAALEIHQNAAEHIGSCALVLNVLVFAAPLSALQRVLRDRSSESLPALQTVLGLLCSACWCGVGLRHQSMPLWVPNAVGILLSLIQLSLIMAYPRVKPTKEVLFEDVVSAKLTRRILLQMLAIGGVMVLIVAGMSLINIDYSNVLGIDLALRR